MEEYFKKLHDDNAKGNRCALVLDQYVPHISDCTKKWQKKKDNDEKSEENTESKDQDQFDSDDNKESEECDYSVSKEEEHMEDSENSISDIISHYSESNSSDSEYFESNKSESFHCIAIEDIKIRPF